MHFFYPRAIGEFCHALALTHGLRLTDASQENKETPENILAKQVQVEADASLGLVGTPALSLIIRKSNILMF